MKRLRLLYQTTIGKKFIAAITGLVLFGFLVGHVAGNLKVFTGFSPDNVPHIDEYGQFLKEVGKPMLPYMMGLWIARAVLLGSLILHVITVIQLAMRSAEARPVDYVRSKTTTASLPAKWMMYSGLLILAFIVFHVLHFTTGTIRMGEFEHGYIYKNLESSFSSVPVAMGYVFVMICLGFHLFHGVWSMFQTLGLDNPDRNAALRWFAIISTVAISAGFAAVPVAFMLGVLPAPIDYVHELLTKH